jgi:hypothetical protein
MTDMTVDPSEPDEPPVEPDGDDSVHAPGDGTEDPPEPGAGLGEEVEDVDPDELRTDDEGE